EEVGTGSSAFAAYVPPPDRGYRDDQRPLRGELINTGLGSGDDQREQARGGEEDRDLEGQPQALSRAVLHGRVDEVGECDDDAHGTAVKNIDDDDRYSEGERECGHARAEHCEHDEAEEGEDGGRSARRERGGGGPQRVDPERNRSETRSEEHTSGTPVTCRARM